jgi:hypothetical protein
MPFVNSMFLRRIVRPGITATVLIFGFGLPEAWAAQVFVANSYFTTILVVDLETGDRRLIDMYQYPGIIKTGDLTAESESSVLVETVSALQWTGIFRLHIETGETVPVSGEVLGDSSNLLGGGPDSQPGLRGQSPGVAGSLYTATGNRQVVSQSDPPAVGDGVPLYSPGRLASGRIL